VEHGDVCSTWRPRCRVVPGAIDPDRVDPEIDAVLTPMMTPANWKGLALAVVVLGAGAQFFGPARTNPSAPADRALGAKVPIPEDVDTLLTRSCRNCHSNETRWPWYAYAAPGSWLVIDHVNEGREHFNLSDWGFTTEEGADMLDQMCEEAKGGSMPLRSYTWIHWDAKLTPEDVTRLCKWTADTAELLVSH